MNSKSLINFFFWVSISFFTGNVLAQSSVWKISKEGNYFYLGGTIHVLSAKDHPLPEEFNVAYQDSSKIIFEIDLSAMNKPELQEKFQSSFLYQDERTLVSALKATTYKRLENFFAERNIPISTFYKYQPWAVTLIATQIEYQLLGMEAKYGVDTHFYNLAIADNKQNFGLETVDEQLSAISSMSLIEENAGVEYTLDELKRLPSMIESMKKFWRTGYVEGFTQSDYFIDMQTLFPEMYDALIVGRNNEWMKKLVLLTADEENEFVMVGALHLNGKDGLLNQLENSGFNVEQL